MAGDTAKLLASLDLQDQMSPKLKAAMGNVSAAEGRVASLGTRFSTFASNLKGGVSNAIGTFTGRLKQAAFGVAAFAGIGGILSLGGALKTGLDRARSFGDEVVRLARLTGLATTQTSLLAGVFEHFNVDADSAARLSGMAEKNLFALAGTAQKAKKFQDTYNLSLVDASGKLVDYNTLLLRSADFYNNKSIPAQTKAAALAKIFGRNWQDLLPILAAGRKGIGDVEAELSRMGLTLNDDNIKALQESKTATRDWGTALSGLELQLGLKILPHLTDLAKTATAFVGQHGKEIVAFFGDVADFAGNAASTVGKLAGTISGFWNSIPAGFRDLLVKGIVADRAVKFLFGFSPVGSIASAVEGGFAKAVGSGLAQAGLGKLFVQPVFVTNMGGLGGAGGGVPAVAGGGLGIVGGALSTLGIGAALFDAAHQLELVPDRLAAAQKGDIAGLIRSLASDAPESITGAIAKLFTNFLPKASPTGDAEATDQAIRSGFGRDYEALERVHQAILHKTDHQAVAKLAKTNDDLERLRQGMLSKQSTANARLAQIAHQKPPSVKVIVPVTTVVRTSAGTRITSTTMTSSRYSSKAS